MALCRADKKRADVGTPSPRQGSALAQAGLEQAPEVAPAVAYTESAEAEVPDAVEQGQGAGCCRARMRRSDRDCWPDDTCCTGARRLANAGGCLTG